MRTIPDSKPAKRSSKVELIGRKDPVRLLQNFFRGDRGGLYSSTLFLKIQAFALATLRYWACAGDIELRVQSTRSVIASSLVPFMSLLT